MTTTHQERQDVYDFGPEFTLPDLATVAPQVSRVGEADTIKLSSVYYDTADLDLLANGITLRRRNGDIDAGWQLKMPDGPRSRIELTVPPASGGVPKELGDVVRGARRGHSLQAVATVEITRDVQRLLAADGRVLAVVSDDTVHSRAATHPDSAREWREVEVELGEVGDEDLLAAIGARMVRAGAAPMVIRSKLAHALAATASFAGRTPTREPASVGGVVRGYLSEQYAAVIAADVAVRRGDEAPAGALAMALGRIRNVLQAFGELFHEQSVADLIAELTWLDKTVSEAAEAEVLHERVVDAIGRVPPELVVGPIATRVESALLSREEELHKALSQTMKSRRYLGLLDHLARWISSPPMRDVAEGPPSGITRFTEATAAALAEQLLRVRGADSNPAELRRLQDAAGRARDAEECVASKAGKRQLGRKKARRRARRSREFAALVAEHQRALATAELLRQLGAGSSLPDGDSGFTYGLLYSLEEVLARDAWLRLIEAGF